MLCWLVEMDTNNYFTWDQSGNNFSCDGLAKSSEKLRIMAVKPIRLENLAGGLFSSFIPHTSSAVGTETPIYQTHRECLGDRDDDDDAVVVVVVLVEEAVAADSLPPSF